MEEAVEKVLTIAEGHPAREMVNPANLRAKIFFPFDSQK
jgi:hypothetical protein